MNPLGVMISAFAGFLRREARKGSGRLKTSSMKYLHADEKLKSIIIGSSWVQA